MNEIRIVMFLGILAVILVASGLTVVIKIFKESKKLREKDHELLIQSNAFVAEKLSEYQRIQLRTEEKLGNFELIVQALNMTVANLSVWCQGVEKRLSSTEEQVNKILHIVQSKRKI